jgi:hypothetical protein
MPTHSTGILLAVAAALSALAAPAAHPGARSPEALEAEIAALQPPKLVWREVAWKKCLLEGLHRSREEKKPVLLWAFINADPREERC